MLEDKKKNSSYFISFFISVFIFSCLMYAKGEKKVRIDDVSPLNFLNNNFEEIDDETLKIISDKIGIEINEDNKDEIALFNAIYNNKNLSEKEKNIFYGYYSVVEDFINLDKDKAYNSLSKVSINYVERDEKVLPSTLGDYDYLTGKINIYAEDNDNNILLHEGTHTLFSSNLPRAIQEGMTELIVNESFTSDPFYENCTYPLEVSYVKMLCELIGTDKVIDAYVLGDYSIIYREMDKYNNGSEMSSYKILNIYEDAYKNINHIENSVYTAEEQTKAYKLIEKIYKMKYGNSGINYNDFKYLHELSGAGFEENAIEFFSDYIFYYGVLEKAYISSQLKEKFPNSNTVNFTDRHFVLINQKN